MRSCFFVLSKVLATKQKILYNHVERHNHANNS